MKTSYLKSTLDSTFRIIVCSVWLMICGHLSVYAQTEASGMDSRPNNYTSFGANRLSSPQSLPYNAPCTECEEDLSARTEFTKTYYGKGKNADKIYTQSGYSPLHIKDARGNWITFDSRLRKQAPGLYTAPDQHSPVTIDLNAGSSSVRNADGEIHFNNRPELLWKTDTEIKSLGKADFSNHTAGDDGVYVTNVWPGIDMEMRVLMGALKTNFILKNRPSQQSGMFIIRDELQLSGGLKLQKNEGELQIVTATGTEAFTIATCVGHDSHPGRDNGIQIFDYALNGNTVDILLPLEVLKSPDLVYPYTIDPLVNSANTLAQASITGSGYGATCFSNYCSYNLTVPTPANAVIVDALWSFNYIASGLCWTSDGAVTFATGACVSPNQAGYYWFCNGIGSGTCTGNNISLFSHVSSCLPAPSCAPQNVSFSMRFYRCYSSGGCSNTCIGAASPWTMTLVGRTLEHTNPTNPITVSSTSVCQGQSINASTAGSYGVPPYTYNWSLSPTGTPSAGTGSSASITFPTAGSQTLYATTTDACGQQVTSSVAITVNPGPSVTAAPNPVNLCSGATTGIALTSTPTGATFNWTTTPTNVSGSAAGSGNTISQTLTATGATPGTVVYNVTATANGCTSPPATVNVTVNPIPTIVVTPATQTICSGSSTSLALSSPVAGAAFNWTATNSNTSGGGTGSGTTISETLTNVDGINNGTTTYSITASANTCSGAPVNAVVTVNPSQNAGFTYSPSSICITASNPTPTLSAPSVTGTFSGTGVVFTNAATGTIDLAATGAGNYTISYTTSGPCPATQTQNITISNAPDASFSYASPFCQNATNPAPQLNPGAVNGVYSASSPNLVINSTTGVINLAGSTPGTYTVTNTIAASGGCSATSQTASVTISAVPTATLSGGGSYCQGGAVPTASIQLTGTGPWTVGITNGSTPQTLTVTSSPYVYTPAGPGTYTLTSVSNANCSGTVSGSATVTLNPTPSVNPMSPVTACANSTVTVPAFTGTPAGTTFTWTNSSTQIGLGASGGGNVNNFTATNTTTAPISGQITVTPTLNGCTGTPVNFTITINPKPTPIITGTTTYCAGAPASPLTANPSSGGQITWYSNPGLTTVVGNGTTYTPPSTVGTTTYYMTENFNGCISNAVPVTVTVNPLPTVNAGNDQTLCASTPVVLTGSGAVSYTWNNGVTNGQPFTQAPGSVTYTVTGTNANGCSNTDQVTITTIDSPALSVANTQHVTCFGLANGSATVTVTGGIAPYTYNWSPSGGTGATASGLQAGTYTVTVTDNVGCSDNTLITITQPGQLTVTPSVVDYSCGITDGEIALSVTGGTGPYSYNWSPNVSTSNTAIGLSGGNYSIIVTDAQGCNQTTQVTVDVIESDLISIYADAYMVNEGESTGLYAEPAPGLVYDSVVWSPATGLSCTTCLNPTATPSTPTTYYATIYTPDGCVDTDTLMVSISIPCGEVFIPTIFSPNGDGLNDFLCVKGPCIVLLELTIYDRWGEMVFYTDKKDICWDGYFRGRPAQSGVYVYKATVTLDDGKKLTDSGSITVTR